MKVSNFDIQMANRSYTRAICEVKREEFAKRQKHKLGRKLDNAINRICREQREFRVRETPKGKMHKELS